TTRTSRAVTAARPTTRRPRTWRRRTGPSCGSAWAGTPEPGVFGSGLSLLRQRLRDTAEVGELRAVQVRGTGLRAGRAEQRDVGEARGRQADAPPGHGHEVRELSDRGPRALRDLRGRQTGPQTGAALGRPREQ